MGGRRQAEWSPAVFQAAGGMSGYFLRAKAGIFWPVGFTEPPIRREPARLGGHSPLGLAGRARAATGAFAGMRGGAGRVAGEAGQQSDRRVYDGARLQPTNSGARGRAGGRDGHHGDDGRGARAQIVPRARQGAALVREAAGRQARGPVRRRESSSASKRPTRGAGTTSRGWAA